MIGVLLQVMQSLEAGSWIAEEDFECDQFFPVCKVGSMVPSITCFDSDGILPSLSWERSGSVVGCLTRDREAAGWSLTTVTAVAQW